MDRAFGIGLVGSISKEIWKLYTPFDPVSWVRGLEGNSILDPNLSSHCF